MRQKDIILGFLILWASVSGLLSLLATGFNPSIQDFLVTLFSLNTENLFFRLFIILPWVLLIIVMVKMKR